MAKGVIGLIEIKHLSKKYGDYQAVNDLTFSIPNGKIYGFLGPNGAGKSTTLNMLTGYLAPNDGEIIIDGIDMNEDPEKAKKKIGYLPEIPPLYEDMFVYEYLNFAARLKKIKKEDIDQRVEEGIEKAGLKDVEHRLIRNLSKGYRQRVGLAQAILGDPDIIILDEPMVGLDPKQIIEIRELIKTLAESKTVLMSSHILSEISAICDHVLILSKGRLVASDTPENLEKRFASSGELKLVLKTDLETAKNIVETLNLDLLSIIETEDCVEIKCTIENVKQDCERIFYRCVIENAPILHMESIKATLEEVFLSLTQNKEEENNVLYI